MVSDKTAPQVKMDERHHVEEPFLHQLETMPGLHWKVLHLDNYQAPAETQRTEFTQIVMKEDFASALRKINPWLETDQVQEGGLLVTLWKMLASAPKDSEPMLIPNFMAECHQA